MDFNGKKKHDNFDQPFDFRQSGVRVAERRRGLSESIEEARAQGRIIDGTSHRWREELKRFTDVNDDKDEDDEDEEEEEEQDLVMAAPKREIEGLEKIFETLNTEDRGDVFRILYGKQLERVQYDGSLEADAAAQNIELKGYRIPGQPEQMRAPRLVKVAAIQNAIVLPTTAPIKEQRDAIHKRVGELLDIAGRAGANVVGLQETWHMPFAFCTRERLPWTEMAEPIDGPTTKFLIPYAQKYNMVIINPILERDEAKDEVIWNTAVIISNTGRIIGRSRKNHIPRVGDFNESTYYMESTMGHPVFETAFGRIGVNICYGRDHPLHWTMYALNGAEIIFNPSATIAGVSEPLWGIEARNAAIANHVFTVGINRVGTEVFPNEFTSTNGKPAHKDFGHFFGSSYVAAPDGLRTPPLSRTSDGVLVTEVDLNLNRQVKDHWGFRMTQRLDTYAK